MVKLIFDTPNRSADLRYVLSIHVSDPVFFADTGNRKAVCLSPLELEWFREKNTSGVEAIPLRDVLAAAGKLDVAAPMVAKMALALLSMLEVPAGPVSVPLNFNLLAARVLERQGFTVEPLPVLYPERTVKRPDEIRAIREALQKTEELMAIVASSLAEATVTGEALSYRGEPLTAERLKREVEREGLARDLYFEEGMIIASGDQTAVPHHPGSGVLRANQPIIVDLYPRSRASGYFADMTRTFVKGEPPEHTLRMHAAVMAAHSASLLKFAPGERCDEIYRICAATLEASGFETSGDSGFVHSAGHGLGLDIHEPPRFGPAQAETLKAGNVVTIEPGLYYPGLGGVRVEDVAVITASGHELLTSFPRDLELP